MRHLPSFDSKIESLKTIEIFKPLPDEKLELLASDCLEETINPGDALFREGDPGDSMFVILSGKLAVEKGESMIARSSAGNYFGEMALIDDQPRSATVTALTESRVLKIKKEEFFLHIADNPQALMAVLKTVSERARENLTALNEGIKIFKTQKKLTAELQHLLDDTTNEIYFFDSESYQFINLNTPASKNLGYKNHEITGLTLFDVMSEMTRENFEKLVMPLRSGSVEEASITGLHRRKDGSTYPIEVRFKLQNTETPPVFVGMGQDVSQLTELKSENKNLTRYDSLTGLPNRELTLETLGAELLQANRKNKSIAVLLMDLDEFKTVNNSLGHSAGDLMLKAVAKRLNDWSPKNSQVARFGGDEFIIILSGDTIETEARTTADSLLKLFQNPFSIDGQEVYIGLSIGISYYPLDGNDSETLIRQAHAAMYVAKDQGKNKYCHYHSDMEAQAKKKLILESDLRKALDRNEFVLYYQPKLELDTETIIGFESLIRWNHPSRGLVPPLDFIPLAEKTKIIIPLGEWIIRTACQQIKTWLDMGFPNPYIAVNLSAHQFSQPNLVSRISEIIEETGILAKYLEVEITESVLMENSDMAAAQLTQLSKMGIDISIDDFGTGYSSLSYLNIFPLNNLKIDRAFVKDITSEENATLAKAIVTLSKALNLKTIAEGVETETQKQVLRSIGCDTIQGYFLSKPVPAEEATKLLIKS
jgi:diguanylate cyclase (GGDEF)-like protein/PAS domain S-box-containing protein